MSAFVLLEFRHSYFRFRAVSAVIGENVVSENGKTAIRQSQRRIENTNVEIRVKQMHSLRFILKKKICSCYELLLEHLLQFYDL